MDDRGDIRLGAVWTRLEAGPGAALVTAAVAAVAALEADQSAGLTGNGTRVSEGSAGVVGDRIHHGYIFVSDGLRSHGPGSKPALPHLYARADDGERIGPANTGSWPPLRDREGASYIELALFAALLVVWIAPGMEGATAVLRPRPRTRLYRFGPADLVRGDPARGAVHAARSDSHSRRSRRERDRDSLHRSQVPACESRGAEVKRWGGTAKGVTRPAPRC